MDDQPRAGVAGLAAVVEDPPADGRRGRGQVADVGEDDLRALAAELERDGLDVRLADRPQQRPADLGRAGERDLVDARMAREGVADDRAGTGHDVEDAVGQAGLGRQLGEAQGAQRRLAGRLEDDRVAGRERRAELPGGDDQRVVPGHDRGDHADRLAGDERQRVGPGRADLAVDLVDRLGVPLERRGGARDVHPERVADRLADVERLEQGELVEVLADRARPAGAGPACGAAGGWSAQRRSSNDRRAAATARSTSSTPPSATAAIRDPSRPAMSSNVRPEAAGTNRPSMNSSVRGAIAAARASQSAAVGGRRWRRVLMPRTGAMAASSRTMPEPGRGRDVEHPVGTRPDRLGEHEVAPLGRPAGRVVRELEERPAADAGRDVQVGQQPDPVRPGVRREPAVAGEGELGERARPRHPGRQHDVGLVDVERVGVERGQQLGERPGHLAAGDADPGRRAAQRGQARAGPSRPAAPRPTGRRARRAAPRPRGPRPGRASATCRRPSASPG